MYCPYKTRLKYYQMYFLCVKLSKLDHPNVVKLLEVYEDDDHVYLVLELMTGGELFDRIVDKEHYSEKEASDCIRPVVDCIKYCHSLGIAHRDLKVSIYIKIENSLRIYYIVRKTQAQC